MIVIISILAAILMYLLIDIIGVFYIGGSENYNEGIKILEKLNRPQEGLEEKRPFFKAKRKSEWRKPNQKKKEVFFYVFIAIITFLVFSIFFSSVLMGFFMAALVPIIPILQKKQKEEKQKQIVLLQFAEALRIINTSLKAGESMTNSLISCSRDLDILYKREKEQSFLLSFQKLRADLELGLSLDAVLTEFSRAWKYEEIRNFTAAVIAVREKGGNMTEVMENVTKTISDKMEIEMEIERQTASKKFEAKILSGLPIFLFFILSLISKDYMRPLFDTAIGRVLVGLCVLLILLSTVVTKKIVEVKI